MKWILACTPLACLGAIFLLLPDMTRKGFFFARRVASDFGKSQEARQTVRGYRMAVAIALSIGLLLLLSKPSGSYNPLALLVLIAVSAAAYYRANRSVAPIADSPKADISIELSTEPDRVPWFVWVGIGPLLLLSGAAFFLSLHWNAIPMHFPVHSGLDGTPDRWAEKNTKGVYGPILFGLELCTWLMMLALASWYGARRSSMRTTIMKLVIGVNYGLALLFAFIGLQPLLHFPMWTMLIFVLCMTAMGIGFGMKAASEPSGPSERTPDECWKAGFIYYNPNDAVLFVERRIGIGYTINFANRWSWLVFLGPIFIIATAPLVIA